MKLILCIVAVFSFMIDLHAAERFQTYVLETENYVIEITPRCSEGYARCDRVSYKGVNKKSGAVLMLRNGVTLHTTCADGVTPCRFVGYSFRNGNYSYFVGEDLDGEKGTLSVKKNNKVLLMEQGIWQ